MRQEKLFNTVQQNELNAVNRAARHCWWALSVVVFVVDGICSCFVFLYCYCYVFNSKNLSELHADFYSKNLAY